MILIVVESPTKAKAISGYLKNEKQKYSVLSTYGHIRNLVKKSGSIETANDYAYHWETTEQWNKHKKEVLTKAHEAQTIIIATDLDREGEGIAWHFKEILSENKIQTPTQRIVFNSIEKSAILNSLNNPTTLRLGLVESYLARIGLDYLFGFSVSPLLWRKVPCCKSAGRVQSVALRLIVEQEALIKDFKSQDYITIHAQFEESPTEALMVEFNGQKFENGNIFNKEIDAQKLDEIFDGEFIIDSIKTTQSKQNPPAPFITSTLLQAASSQLNFSPAVTMQLAQKLYEGFSIDGAHKGLITYMRTDSVTIEPSAIQDMRKIIEKHFGPKYLPASANIYKSNSKAQEAHEAIRPVDFQLHPSKLNLGDKKLEDLYKLIWQRAIASQMPASIQEAKTISMNGTHTNDTSVFQLRSIKIVFDGFKAVLDKEEAKEVDFSKLTENSQLILEKVFSKEHQTQPPRRFSEASLIAQLEKLAIGRPSTYSKILQVLYEREYATKDKKIIYPTQKAWVVTAFLKGFFPQEVAYEFTANLEEELDNLNQSNGHHKETLKKFWDNLHVKIEDIKNKAPNIISTTIQEEFSSYFLKEKQICSQCSGKLILKISSFGAIIGCENYPECKEIFNLEQKETNNEKQSVQLNGNEILIKNGPYGPYIEYQGNEKVKRVPIPKIWQNEELGIEKIEFLASLPKEIGVYNDKKITVSIGQFGPFIKYDDLFVSIKNPLDITLEEAINGIKNKIENKLKKPTKPKMTQKAAPKTKQIKKSK